jgi:hypothetical protein
MKCIGQVSVVSSSGRLGRLSKAKLSMSLSWARRATLTRVDYSWVDALALSRMNSGRLMYTKKQVLNNGDNSERPDAFPLYQYRPL